MFKWLWRKPAMRKIDKVIIHCSATPPSMNIGSMTIRKWHVDKGWRDIGYHFVIKRDGTIQDGRSIEEVGAHTKGHNRDSIGICLVGGVNASMRADDNFTDKQWQALRGLLRVCKADYKRATIHGHNEYAAKACPSFDVQHELTAGRLTGIV